MAKKKPAPTSVASLCHKDKRKNIPTEELRDFVAQDEHAPKTMLYPRDPSLDPQLVWKGKDEQGRRHQTGFSGAPASYRHVPWLTRRPASDARGCRRG